METNQLFLHPSSSSLPRTPHYDVFLSFRGEDTRKSFTDHLFAALCRVGVHTFRDAEELRKGEDISADLTKAIRDSMISIIVFSKTYAASRWCLEELVEILECKEKENQVVFPVFYDVDPSEVRKQTDGFGDALTLLQQRFGAQKVSCWKAALTKVANLSGWDLHTIADRYESKFIEKIVEKVLQVINCQYFDIAKYPEIVGYSSSSSSNSTLPLFLKKKQIFVIVMISSCGWCYLKYKTTGSWKQVFHRGQDKAWGIKAYEHFTEPNKVEEVKMLIEFYSPVEQGVEEILRIETCIAYEEEGEVCFFPINPNKLIKFHPHSTHMEKHRLIEDYSVDITLTINSPTPDSDMETQQHNR